MTPFRFRAVKEQHFSDETGGYAAYGILAEQRERRAWIPVLHVEDVSADGAFAARLAARCARFQLDPIHLLDVVADAIP